MPSSPRRERLDVGVEEAETGHGPALCPVLKRKGLVRQAGGGLILFTEARRFFKLRSVSREITLGKLGMAQCRRSLPGLTQLTRPRQNPKEQS